MAQTIFIAGAVHRGIPVYIMKKFDFVKMLEAVQNYKITTLTMVPPIVVVRPPLLFLTFPMQFTYRTRHSQNLP